MGDELVVGCRLISLCKPPSIGCAEKREVGIVGRLISKEVLEVDLARGRIDKVAPAGYEGNPLFSVVNDHGEVVGKAAACPFHDEVAAVAQDVSLNAPKKEVVKGKRLIRRAKTHGSCPAYLG